MKKKRLDKFGTIFGFTFKQSTKDNAFKIMTYVIPAVIFMICLLVNVIPASMDDDEPAIVKKVYIVDETGTGMVGDIFGSLIDKEIYPDTSIQTIMGKEVEEVCADISQDEIDSLVIKASMDKDDEGIDYFRVTAIVPEWSEVPEDEIEDLLSLAGICIDSIKVATADIDYESLIYLSSSIITDVVKAGESPDTFAEFMLKSIMPMILILIVYMMVLVYGQSIGKVVVAEKSSKLMEMLLTSVQPDALISGKILAQASIAIIQFLLWIFSAVAGFAVGSAVAESIDPSYENAVVAAVKLIMEESQSAFSPLAIVLSVLAIIFGFLLYCVLSGLVASFIGKAEELSSGMGIYNMLVVIGFFCSYFPVMMENENINRIVRVFPLTSAYKLGADILVGNAGIFEGLIDLAVLIITNIVLIIITARVYKAKVFYAGNNPVKNILSRK